MNVCSLSSNKGTMLFQAKLASSDLQTLHIAQIQKVETSCFHLIKKTLYSNGYHLASLIVVGSYVNTKEKKSTFSEQKIKKIIES